MARCFDESKLFLLFKNIVMGHPGNILVKFGENLHSGIGGIVIMQIVNTV